MSEHIAIVRWEGNDPGYLQGAYSREHRWTFDGGITVPASASPDMVPIPFSNPAHVDPEEAFVASVASCHMLTFLYLASRAGHRVEQYVDKASGMMTKNDNDVLWISEITLRPKIVYGGDSSPTPEEERRLHHEAHEQCFISNSVKTKVRTELG